MSLAARTQALYDRLKAFPEGHDARGPYLKPDAFSAFLELRQLFEREILSALYKLERDDPDYVTIPRYPDSVQIEPTQEMIEAAWAVLDAEGIEPPPVETMRTMWAAMEDAKK